MTSLLPYFAVQVEEEKKRRFLYENFVLFVLFLDMIQIPFLPQKTK